MRDRAKVAATGTIWFVVLAIFRSAFWMPVSDEFRYSGSTLMMMALFLSALAVISINIVWRSDRRTALSMDGGVPKTQQRQADPREGLMRTLGALEEDEATAVLNDLRVRLRRGTSNSELSTVGMREERRQRD